MSKIILIYLLLLLTANLSAQQGGNYIPLEFENVEPIWIHVSSDSSLIGVSSPDLPGLVYDGYGHLLAANDVEDDLPILDGFGYLVTQTYDFIDMDGALIEKIDLTTGQVIWQNGFDLRDEIYREFIFRSVIEESDLVLYSIEVREDFGQSGIYWGNGLGYLKKRFYNLETGNLVRETFPDTLSEKLWPIRSKRNGHGGTMDILPDDEVEVITVGQNNDIGWYLKIDTLDERSNIISELDTFAQNIDLDWTDTGINLVDLFIRDDNEDLYFLNYYNPRTQPADSSSIQLLVIDKDNIVTNIPIDFIDLEDLERLRIMNITQSQLVIQATYVDTLGINILFINKNTGNLERKVRYRDRITTLQRQILPIYDEEFILMNYSVRADGKCSLDFYISEGEEMVALNSFIMSIADWRTYPDDIQMLANGDFLVTLKYTELLPIGLTNGSFSAILRVTPEQIGLSTSVAEVSEEYEFSYKLYPNPAVTEVTIELPYRKTYVVAIHDLQGKEISRVEYGWGGTQSLDVRGLASGAYRVVIYDGEHRHSELLSILR